MLVITSATKRTTMNAYGFDVGMAAVMIWNEFGAALFGNELKVKDENFDGLCAALKRLSRAVDREPIGEDGYWEIREKHDPDAAETVTEWCNRAEASTAEFEANC